MPRNVSRRSCAKRPWRESCKAIPPQRTGHESRSAGWHQHQAGLHHVWHQRNLLSLRSQIVRREPADSGLVAEAHNNPQALGFWPVFSVSSQCERLWLEPQARVSHLPGIRAQPAYQAQTAAQARLSRRTGCTNRP